MRQLPLRLELVISGGSCHFCVQYASDSLLEDETEPSKQRYLNALEHLCAHFSQMYVLVFICLYVCVYIYIYMHLFIYAFVYVFIYLFIYLFMHLCMHLFIYEFYLFTIGDFYHIIKPLKAVHYRWTPLKHAESL